MEENNEYMDKGGLSTFMLKMIAVTSMTVDHIGAVLLPEYIVLRYIGRIAFPIYCFLIVNGFRHTGNCAKYLCRMALFAVISEIFFDLAVYNRICYPWHQNVFFTLTIGLAMIILIEEVRRKYLSAVKYYLRFILEGVIVFCSGILALMLHTDYTFYGILMIYGFYVFEHYKRELALWQIIINVVLCGQTQIFAVLALPFIYMYNGKQGRKYKWIFYIFYPAHLFVLFVLKYMLK